MWTRLWRSPQAIVWEADGVHDTVALYVRAFIEAANPEASASARTFVRQLQDSLLLSIPALHAARYTIVDNAPAPATPAAPARAAASKGRRHGGLVVVSDEHDDAD